MNLEPEYGIRNRLGLIIAPILLILTVGSPPPEGMSLEAWKTIGLTLFMASLWVTEAIPVAVTALSPIVLMPILGIADIKAATSPYANYLIFLFMGGFMIALAMQKWMLHKRIALFIIGLIGSSPIKIIYGFSISAAFLSMWLSNTATALMMLPIALSIIDLVDENCSSEEEKACYTNFKSALLLSIAYACNIGGLATLIGTPPNAMLAAYFFEEFNYEIDFASWMMVGVPLVAISLPLTITMLTKYILPVRLKSIPGGGGLIAKKAKEMGAMSLEEKLVLTVFAITAFSWITRPFLLTPIFPGLSDAGISVLGGMILFVIPSNFRKGKFLLDWETAKTMPWGILLLFGGGLSLAGAFSSTGLSAFIGSSFQSAQLNIYLLIPILVLVVIFLTEVTSNTAVAATLLPVLSSAAIGMGQNPMLLAFPMVIAASCAFMLPVATPPNAVVFSSERITMPQMAKAGFWYNMLFVVLITLCCYSLLMWVFSIQIGQVGVAFK